MINNFFNSSLRTVPFEARHTQPMQKLAKTQMGKLISYPVGHSEKERARICQEVLDQVTPGHHKWVLEIEGIAKGFVVYSVKPGWRKNPVGSLDLLAVDPSAQRHGGGQLLVKTALTQMKEAERIHVQITDHALKGFYQEKCNFRYSIITTKDFAELVWLPPNLSWRTRTFRIGEAYLRTLSPVASTAAAIYGPMLGIYCLWQQYQKVST